MRIGRVEAVIGVEADEETDELLIADLEVVAAGITAAVDDGSRIDGLAAA